MQDIFYIRRSIRRFKERPVDKEILEEILDRARLYPSAANLQPVRFIVTLSDERISRALPYLRWAAYVKPRRDPIPGKGPKALVLVCHDRRVSDTPYVPYDVSAACQTLLLAAVEKGLGGCWLGAIDRDGLGSIFDISSHWYLHCVLALGYPDECPVIEQVKDGDIRYFLDQDDVLRVPKRSLSEVVLWVQ